MTATLNVVDISKWQAPSDVNWPELVKAGVKAVLIQLSHGMEYEQYAQEHIANAEKYGVIWHGYHYYQGSADEVAFSVSNAQALGLKKGAHMFLDMEGDITGNWSDQFYKFRNVWDSAGWKSGIYLSDSPYKANFDNDQIVADGVYRWIASYGKEPENYDVWQMTGGGGPLIGANTIVMDRDYDKTGALVVTYKVSVAGGVGFKATSTGGNALMYSPDNVNFKVALSPYGWNFDQAAADLMWSLISGKVSSSSGSLTPDTNSFINANSISTNTSFEFDERGINVKWFGAVGNGQADDSKAIQAAFDYAKAKTLSAEPALKTQYTVVIPGGVYKASNLAMSTVIRLKPLGTVVIQPVASTDTVLTIAQDDAAKGYVWNFPSQQFLRGNLIDGGSGTIYLKGTSEKGSYTGTGLVLGSTTSLGDNNPFGRYRLTGISISNFDTLVQINTKDNYLGSFVGCHFEGGNTGVRFGDDTNNVSTNSGENFDFSHCVIASCTTVGVKINSPVDANFTNSSFDFNATALELNSTIINVNILGGHFEGNDVMVKSDYTSDEWYYNQPKVNLFGTVILDPAVDPIFKGIMLLSMKSTNVTVQQQKLGSYGGLCDYSVNVMGDPDTYYQNGYSMTLSRNLCQLYNADFHDGVKGMTWADTNGTATFEYLASGLPDGGDFAKGLHIKLEDKGTGYIDFTKISVQAGQIMSMGLYAYLESTASGAIGPFSLVAYDTNGNKLTEITDSISLTDFKATTWAWIYSRQLIIPQQAEYVVPRIYFNGELELYTSQLYAGKA